MSQRKFRWAPVGVAIVIVTTGLLIAGPLDPPAGPIAPTPGPEPRVAINQENTPGDADSLFKITQPGSYYLEGNITGVVGKHGIEIVSGGVTLDLNGFDLQGVAGSLDGVTATVPALRNLAVVNGSVRDWGGAGVTLVFSLNCRIADVLADSNGGDGIANGAGSTTSNCSSFDNSARGFKFDGTCTVSNCVASANTGDGFFVGTASTVVNCTATLNSGSGISTGFSNGCSITDCTARDNTLDGIRCGSGCVIRGNMCSFNGFVGDGAGIHAVGTDNRIEGNNCTDADRGIDVDAGGNIIVRNTCSGNTTNWSFVANNFYSSIVNRAGATTLSVNGDSAVSTLGTVDHNANFTY